MYFRVLIYCYILQISNLHGQSIQEMEIDLWTRHSSEPFGNKINVARKLHALDPFNFRAARYICDYYELTKVDSVTIFLDNLIAKYPENSKPYFLRSELLHFEIDHSNTCKFIQEKVRYLLKGTCVNPQDMKIYYSLAEIYYNDFLAMIKDSSYVSCVVTDEKFIDNPQIYASDEARSMDMYTSALMTFDFMDHLWKFNPEIRDVVYYPMKQLENYTHRSDISRINIDADKHFYNCFFPSSYFADLSSSWQSDYSINYLYEIESSKQLVERLSQHLTALDESCLYDANISCNTTIYRFTWLRSFENPIVIRVEKNKDEIFLHWKLGKGMGGYEPKRLEKSSFRKIPIKHWRKFEKLISKSGFDNLYNLAEMPMTDGSRWTIEKKTANNFKAHNTNVPSDAFMKACIYLLSLTDLKISEKDIH